MADYTDLCAWLRANSSGVYRKSAEAADAIESLSSALKEAQEELLALREFAAGRCVIQKVIDKLGPMSLWSKAGLEAHIEREVVARTPKEPNHG